MPLIRKKIIAVFCLGLCSFNSSNIANTFKCNDTTPSANENGFAVVELFTSEGCSSCPPADAVAAGLLQDYTKNVFVLGFHVDYWNYLGWKDNFSNSAYSKRQQEYGNIFHLNSVYTPQVIVNGADEFTGSDKNKLYSAVKKSLQQSSTDFIKISALQDGQKINIIYETGDDDVKLNFALVQLHAETKVQRGENAGSTLRHVNVVRDFITIDPAQKNADVQLLLPLGVTKSDCAVVAFVQNGKSWKITAAAKCGIQ